MHCTYSNNKDLSKNPAQQSHDGTQKYRFKKCFIKKTAFKLKKTSKNDTVIIIYRGEQKGNFDRA